MCVMLCNALKIKGVQLTEGQIPFDEIERLRLTSYVSRHTMAMTLQNQNVPREQISQALGHNNLTTTNVYLDSFDTNIMDKVAQLL